MQAPLGLTMVALAHTHDRDEAGITNDVDACVREFDRAAVGIRVHRRQFLPCDPLHAHTAGVEGKPGIGGAGPQYPGNLGLHRRVRARNDLPDPKGGFHLGLPILMEAFD